MDANRERRVKFLSNKAAGCLGMIAEVRSKCILMKSRLTKATESDQDMDNLEEEALASVKQMKADLARYTRRLDRIYEELRGYGIISDMA